MSGEQVDCLVIGAGLAGLSAAGALVEEGISVRVLEARRRVGGRTLATTAGGRIFDLGGQWLGPTQHRMAALCSELEIPTFPTHTEGRKVLLLDHKLRTYRSSIPSLSPLHLLDLQVAMARVKRRQRAVPIDDPSSATHAARWDGQTVESFKRRIVKTRAVSQLFDAAVRVVFGAEPAELSLLHFLTYARAGGSFRELIETDGGAQQNRIVGGAQQVAERLAEPLGRRVVLQAPVRRLRWGSETVVAETDRGHFAGTLAIVAVPPPLVSRIDFEPDLSVAHHQTLQRWSTGATIKVLALYDEPFWRDAGFSGEAVCNSGPLTVTFDNTSRDGQQPALVGFIVGAAARAWSSRRAEARRQAVIDQLARLFGPRALEVGHYVEKDWGRDPWARGCPTSFAGTGAYTTGAVVLRAPVGPLHWAGTETATEWCGYMEGAVQSGYRAAREVLDRL